LVFDNTEGEIGIVGFNGIDRFELAVFKDIKTAKSPGAVYFIIGSKKIGIEHIFAY